MTALDGMIPDVHRVPNTTEGDSMNDEYRLGSYLRQLREDAHLGQRQAHRERENVPSQGYQSKVERGEFRDVELETLIPWVSDLGGDPFKAFELWVSEHEKVATSLSAAHGHMLEYVSRMMVTLGSWTNTRPTPSLAAAA